MVEILKFIPFASGFLVHAAVKKVHQVYKWWKTNRAFHYLQMRKNLFNKSGASES